MACDDPEYGTELEMVQFELELLTSARWLCRLNAADYARYSELCRRERELLDLAADRDGMRMSPARI